MTSAMSFEADTVDPGYLAHANLGSMSSDGPRLGSSQARANASAMRSATAATTPRFFKRAQSMFNVDSADVFQRCLVAANPLSKAEFLGYGSGATGSLAGVVYVCESTVPADLWGPIWLYQTVVFLMFMSITIAGFLASSGERYVTSLSPLVATAFIFFFFTFFVPSCLWLLAQFWNMAMGVTLPQILCLYGYGNTLWVPVLLLMGSPLISPKLMSPTAILIARLTLSSLAFALSTKFVVSNLHRIYTGNSIPSDSLNAAPPPSRARLMILICAAVVSEIGLSSFIVSFFGSTK